MRTQVKGRNVTVTEALQQYADEKVAHLRKFLNERRIDEVTRVELELMVEKNPSIAEPCIAEATVFTKGPVIRAREAAKDMYAAIDLVTEKLERRVKKYHDKVHGKTRKGREKAAVDLTAPAELAAVAAVAAGAGGAGAAAAETVAEPFDDGRRVVKTKQFALKPMTVEEATLQMELVGHDFFVFTNADTNRTNVVYRRKDGNYGLIEPAEN